MAELHNSLFMLFEDVTIVTIVLTFLRKQKENTKLFGFLNTKNNFIRKNCFREQAKTLFLTCFMELLTSEGVEIYKNIFL